MDHAAQIVIFGLAALAMLTRGILTVHRGETPTTKSGHTWRSAGEAGTFWFLLAAAMLTIALMWLATATGLAGPGAPIGSTAGLAISVVPTMLVLIALIRYRPRRTD